MTYCKWQPWRCMWGKARSPSWDRTCTKPDDCVLKVEKLVCPERKGYKDWPVGPCALNTKSCVRDTNPPGDCEYFFEFVRESGYTNEELGGKK